MISGKNIYFAPRTQKEDIPANPFVWFDGIDNYGKGVHMPSTKVWKNLAGDDTIVATRTGTTAWGDDCAVLNQGVGDSFQVTKSGTTISNYFGNTWTICASVYLDSAVKSKNYTGVFGGEPNNTDGVGICVVLDGTGWVFEGRTPTSATATKASNWNWYGQVNSKIQWNAFNTIIISGSPTKRKILFNTDKVLDSTDSNPDYYTNLRTSMFHVGRCSNQYPSTGAGRVMQGKFYNFMIYERVLTDDECTQFINYSNNRFNS